MADSEQTWFEAFRKSQGYQILHDRPIAYFCAEFAISNYLQTYAGGLGVLAGDTVREASDQSIPLVAIGLYYRRGYQHYQADDQEVQAEVASPEGAGLTRVVDTDGLPIRVKVPISSGSIFVQAWRAQMGAVSIYLLDTDAEGNFDADRRITDRLYVGDRATRLKQELVLGVGGARLLEALNISPIVYHLNEGHSAFLAYEIARQEMQKHSTSFQKALALSCDRLVFTNHTLLPGGHENFSVPLAKSLLSDFAKEVGVEADVLIEGGLTSDRSLFSMTRLAMKLSNRLNAVSKLHAEKAREYWPESNLIPITNGIHLPSWNAILPHEDVWVQHQYNKHALLRIVKETTGQVWPESTLLIGWAKRLVAYKRPLAIFEDIERFKTLAQNSDRPFRILISGKAHDGDLEGSAMLNKLMELIHGELSGLVTYLPNYNLETARLMIAGCDIWLNTPIVGFEACGTSGMKAALNGVLPLTTQDGWVSEYDLFGLGWALNSDDIGQSILDELEYNICPMYYTQNKQLWYNHMKNARSLIRTELSTTKMLRQYIEKMYLPSIEKVHA